MKIWISSEIQSDVASDYRFVRNKIENEINNLLSSADIKFPAKEWVFIAIILDDELGALYKEIKKWRKKNNVVEFRIKINFSSFKESSPVKRIELIIDSISSTVDYMSNFGASSEDCFNLKKILCIAKQNLSEKYKEK